MGSLLSRGLLLCVCVVCLACKEPGPCYGLSVGDRLAIELLEPYDEDSSFEFDLGFTPAPPRCGRDFDLTAPSMLDVRVVEQVDSMLCKHNVVELESEIPWELGARSETFSVAGGKNDNIVEAFHHTTFAGCEGRWGIQVLGQVEPFGEKGNPFLKPKTGKKPPIIMARGIIADSLTTECAASLSDGVRGCTDFFVVTLHRR